MASELQTGNNERKNIENRVVGQLYKGGAISPSEWKKNFRLGDVCIIKHGYAFKSKFMTVDDNDDLPIVVNIVNFRYTGGFRFESTKIQRYTGDYPREFELKYGDILLVMTCQTEGGEILGVPGRIPDNGKIYLHNQRMGLVILKDHRKADLDFLYWLFLSPQFNHHLYLTATGAKILHTAPSRIEEFNFSLPPLPTQRKIASILSAYDDLIENNTRRIKILEEMAQALYREWFVKFRFPGHEKVRMVESELGMVPEGWVLKKLGDIVAMHRGKSYRTTDLVDEGGLPFLNLKCIERGGGFRYDGIKRFQGEYKPAQTAKTGDIVIAVTDVTQERRIIAHAARVHLIDNDFAVMSMDLVKIEPNSEIAKDYLHGLLRFSDFSQEVSQHANGVNVLHLNPSQIQEFKFLLPPTELRNRYAELCASAYQECNVLHSKNANLRRTRDLLLPKLISGALNVETLNINTNSDVTQNNIKRD